MKLSSSARVDNTLLETQTGACSYECEGSHIHCKTNISLVTWVVNLFGLVSIIRPVTRQVTHVTRCVTRLVTRSLVGLCKILFYGKVVVHESMIVCANSPFGWAPHFPLVAHTIAQSSASLRPPLIAIYTVQHW